MNVLIILSTLTFIYCQHITSAQSCTWTNYNFGALDRVVLPWTTEHNDGDQHQQFLISLCRPLTSAPSECGTNASVCRVSNGTAISFGSFLSSFENAVTEDTASKELTLRLQGSACPSGQNNAVHTAFIIFKCGKTLGAPELLAAYGCDAYFEWSTTAACKVALVPDARETKCYVYGSDCLKRDLSPLIKTRGAQLVWTDDDDDIDMYINVCRDISPDDRCQGFAACEVSISNQAAPAVDLGHVEPASTQLLLVEGSSGSSDIVIQYVSNTTSTNADCLGQRASTTIRFRCPARQRGRLPRLMSTAGCQYDVVWETEFACPVSSLVSSTCRLDVGRHGVAIDLTPLASKDPYTVIGSNGASRYNFTLSVCSNATVMCGDANSSRNVAGCQRDMDSNRTFAIGRLDQQSLRYSDGQLTLVYSNGAACGSNFHRQTVIHFHCNLSAGVGRPEFSSEDSCLYIFDWETQYACTEAPLDCQVVAGRQLYDLSALTKTANMANWEVYGTDASQQLLINVCRNVTNVGTAENCPSNAAICLRSGLTTKNVGQFQSSLAFENSSNSVVLQYTDGDVCLPNGTRYSATVVFRCRPGMRTAEPSLLHRSADGCHFDLVWYTASACAVTRLSGANCRVDDPDSGNSFDLSPLTRPGGSYLVKNNRTSHNYYVNVCAPVGGTLCNSSSSDAGVCQIDRVNEDHQVHNGGLANKTLLYQDGLLKLIYINGDSYRSAPVSRRSEIIFLCDADAGVGLPEFSDETNHTYTFMWYTAYACASHSVQCVVVDEKTGARYDLSRLSHSAAEQNWVTSLQMTDGSRRKLYINVCQPVVPLNLEAGSGTCEPTAGVCATDVTNGKETVTMPNMGRPLSGLKVQGPGDLVLRYDSGAACPLSNGTMHPLSVIINFHCSPASKNVGPSPAERQGDCEYYVHWETSEACPVNTSVASDGSCQLRDTATGVAYNLLPLAMHGDSFYSVNVSGHYFRLNICGAVKSCPGPDVAVCDGNVTLGVASSASLQLTSGGLLQLSYKSPDGQTNVVINVACGKTISPTNANPRFIEQSGNTYLFEMATPHACRPTTVTECQAFDGSGRKYDLSPLTRPENGWLLGGTAGSAEKYFINVCHAVSGQIDRNATCTGAAAGGCHVFANGTAYNMGNVVGPPVITGDGTLTLHYVSGDLCHQGAPADQQFYRSTRIMFHCSLQEHEPVFMEMTSTCEYLVVWRTQFACPLQRTVGSNCAVTDPLYNRKFDLGELRDQGTTTRAVNTSAGTFYLNVCGPVTGGKDECGSGSVGACLRQKETDVNVGIYNDKLEYDDGQLLLRYISGSPNCAGNNNYTTTIVFECDHSQRGSRGPAYVELQSTECNHWFEWPTSLACLPFRNAECSVTDHSGNTFDLSYLTQSDDNYETTSADGSTRFAINVCTTLVHSRGVLCPPDAAACVITSDPLDQNQRKYTNIGGLSDSVLSVDTNNQLSINYEGGEVCGSGGQKSQTRIRLQCDKEAVGTKPQFVELQNNCTYVFTWSLREACPSVDRSVTDGNCKVEDPRTGTVYDLSPLKQTPVYTVDYDPDDDDHIYQLSICQPIANSTCGPYAGICQHEKMGEHRGFNAGNASANVTLTDGILRLTYAGGDMCHHNAAQRTTVVTFVCNSSNDVDDSVALGRPDFVSESECTYMMEWRTPLACKQQVSCIANTAGDSQVDLSSLMSVTTGPYNASVSIQNSETLSKASFFINVCRSVNSLTYSPCPAAAAACQRNADGSLLNLGRVSLPPVYDASNHQVHLTYIDGSSCPSGRRWRTTLRFICREGSWKGTPTLVFIDPTNCEYIFDWHTNVVCLASFVPPPGDCRFTSTETSTTIDLSVLKSKNIAVTDRGYQFFASVCGTVNETDCQSAPFCRKKLEVTTNSDDSNNRRYNFVKMVLEDGDLKMVYTRENAACKSSQLSDTAVMFIRCDTSADVNSQPEVQSVTECSASLLWTTPLVCDAVSSCSDGQKCSSTKTTTPATARTESSAAVLDNSNAVVNSGGGTHRGAVTVGIILVVLAVVLIALGIIAVVRVPGRRRAVGGYVLSCFQRFRTLPAAGYKLLGSDEETVRESDSLLQRSVPLTGNIQHYDSDDDLIL